MSARALSYALVLLLFGNPEARAQEVRLSLAQALAVARERAPAIMAARARVAEAQADVVAASLRLDNPEIDVAVGPRLAEVGRQLDFGAGISQMFENGSRRQARIAAANEGVASAEAAVTVAERDALRSASLAFIEAQYLQRQHTVLLDAVKVAADAQHIAERRFAVGDVAILDVNAARSEHARLEAAVHASEADLSLALGSLASALGLAQMPTVTSDLAIPESRELDALLRAVSERPELRVIDADIRQTEARLRLAKGVARPSFGLSARYEHDDGDHVVLGGLTVRLPVFNKGQDISAATTALLDRLRLERQVLTASWAVVVRARFQAIQAQRRALDLIERDALPAALDNEGLARRSYETGQISLIDWIVLRREAVQVRREQLDRLRDIAIATIELDAVAGVLR